MNIVKEIKSIQFERAYDINTQIPKGYTALEFRPPRKGDIFLASDDMPLVATADFAHLAPRLILKKLSQLSYNFTVERAIRPSDIYSGETAESLAKYCEKRNIEVMDFRGLQSGDSYIIVDWTNCFAGLETACKDYPNEYRLIVRPAQPKKHFIWD